MPTLHDVLDPDTQAPAANYALDLLKECKLPPYISHIRFHKNDLIAVEVTNCKQNKLFGFIHITTNPVDYREHRGPRRAKRAILLKHDQSPRHTINKILEICKSIHNLVSSNLAKRKEKKKQHRQNRLTFEEE